MYVINDSSLSCGFYVNFISHPSERRIKLERFVQGSDSVQVWLRSRVRLCSGIATRGYLLLEEQPSGLRLLCSLRASPLDPSRSLASAVVRYSYGYHGGECDALREVHIAVHFTSKRSGCESKDIFFIPSAENSDSKGQKDGEQKTTLLPVSELYCFLACK